MPPKLLSDDKRNVIIRPLAYCKEKEIIKFSNLMNFPIIPCNLCGSQTNLQRQAIKEMLKERRDMDKDVLNGDEYIETELDRWGAAELALIEEVIESRK